MPRKSNSKTRGRQASPSFSAKKETAFEEKPVKVVDRNVVVEDEEEEEGAHEGSVRMLESVLIDEKHDIAVIVGHSTVNSVREKVGRVYCRHFLSSGLEQFNNHKNVCFTIKISQEDYEEQEMRRTKLQQQQENCGGVKETTDELSSGSSSYVFPQSVTFCFTKIIEFASKAGGGATYPGDTTRLHPTEGPGLFGRMDFRAVMYVPCPLYNLPDSILHGIPLTLCEYTVLTRFGSVRTMAALGQMFLFYPVPPWIDIDRETFLGSAKDVTLAQGHRQRKCLRRREDGDDSDAAPVEEDDDQDEDEDELMLEKYSFPSMLTKLRPSGGTVQPSIFGYLDKSREGTKKPKVLPGETGTVTSGVDDCCISIYYNEFLSNFVRKERESILEAKLTVLALQLKIDPDACWTYVYAVDPNKSNSISGPGADDLPSFSFMGNFVVFTCWQGGEKEEVEERDEDTSSSDAGRGGEGKPVKVKKLLGGRQVEDGFSLFLDTDMETLLDKFINKENFFVDKPDDSGGMKVQVLYCPLIGGDKGKNRFLPYFVKPTIDRAASPTPSLCTSILLSRYLPLPQTDQSRESAEVPSGGKSAKAKKRKLTTKSAAAGRTGSSRPPLVTLTRFLPRYRTALAKALGTVGWDAGMSMIAACGMVLRNTLEKSLPQPAAEPKKVTTAQASRRRKREREDEEEKSHQPPQQGVEEEADQEEALWKLEDYIGCRLLIDVILFPNRAPSMMFGWQPTVLVDQEGRVVAEEDEDEDDWERQGAGDFAKVIPPFVKSDAFVADLEESAQTRQLKDSPSGGRIDFSTYSSSTDQEGKEIDKEKKEPPPPPPFATAGFPPVDYEIQIQFTLLIGGGIQVKEVDQ